MSEKMYEKLKDNVYFPYFDIKKKHDLKDLSREECMKRFAEMNEERKPFMIRYENPFMNIPSYADKFFGMFSEEDDIVVQEKIDGSNSHIHVTKDGVTCYGNNYITKRTTCRDSGIGVTIISDRCQNSFMIWIYTENGWFRIIVSTRRSVMENFMCLM